MTARRQVFSSGSDETLVAVIRTVQLAGAAEFELRYEALNRELRPDEDPTPEDTIRWTCTATFVTGLGKVDRVGTAVAEPGESHDRAMQYAAGRLVEGLGANLVLLDMSDRPEPRR